MNLGWISINRKLLKHDIFKFNKQYSRFEAWVWLLLRANYEDRDVCIGNKIYKLKRGQMIISQLKVRLKFGWSNTRLTNFLKLLKNKGSIEYETNTKMTIVTILKYDSYQNQQYQKQIKPITKTKQKNINNNINKDNKEIREGKFINLVMSEGLKIKPSPDTTVVIEFCDYWTESNLSGTRMKFELQKTFDINRRLKKWIKNSKDWNLKPKANLQEYKKTTSGHYIGYCDKCNESSFYKEFDLKGDSTCCSAKINIERKVK